MRTRALGLIVFVVMALLPASAALPQEPVTGFTNPIAIDEDSYQEYGRVFSDPQGCQANAGEPTIDPVSPYAKGNACAQDYLSVDEIVEGLTFLQSRYPDLVELVRLDEAYDDPEFLSAGIGRTVTAEDGSVQPYGRDRTPLYMVKVTDATSPVPEADRLHFVYGLSLHGPEPAGRETGPRAVEDLVTWAACEMADDRAATTPACATEGPFPKPIVESDTERPVPTAGAVLQETVQLFTFNNPDGHRMGQRRVFEYRDGEPNPNFRYGTSTLRGNGHGVDLNRDWPAVGYTLKSHQTGSEPETRGFVRALEDIRDSTTRGAFAGGIDLHGMGNASAFSYTLLGADQRDYRKNQITVDTSLRTYEDQTERLCWSPHIGDTDCDGVEDNELADIPVADQWGTIYDTLGYTITGGYGNWMDDSRVGLGGVGINNEMALRTDTHEATLNQTYIDGNKGLIYSLVSALMFEEEAVFAPSGRVGYVFNPTRLVDDGFERPVNPGLPAQDDIDVMLPCLALACGPGTYGADASGVHYEFDVLGPEDGVWNGGFSVRSTTARHNTTFGYSTASVVLERLDEETGEWVEMKDVSRTNVSFNDPEPGRWRASLSLLDSNQSRRLEVHFDPDFAEMSPGQLPIDVSSMDFFAELDQYAPDGSAPEAVEIAAALADPTALDAYDTLVVTNFLGDAAYLTETLGLTATEVDAYFDALDGFAQRGGNLVLLDAALNALHEIGVVTPDDVQQQDGLAAFYGFRIEDDITTYDDTAAWPLAAGVDVPGAAERTAGNRQAVEPTPLGFSPSGNSAARMPFWGVDRAAWEGACGKADPLHCTTAATSSRGSLASVGEISQGDGVIRIIGGLLPDPLMQTDDRSDNRYGLASYAISYTGYQVFESVVDYQRSD